MKTQIDNKKRKFLLMLPLLIIPFTTMGFAALGGGQGDTTNKPGTKAGLNVKLPDAHNANTVKDKLSYYEQAITDSLKHKQQGANDPYYKDAQPNDSAPTASSLQPSFGAQALPGSSPYRDPNEAKVYEKLGALQKALNQPVQPNQVPGYVPGDYRQPVSVNTMDVDRLEQMMKAMQSGGNEKDPETEQLNNMLERILDIQHPERVKEKIKDKEDFRKGQVYPVTAPVEKNIVTTLDGKSSAEARSGFYGLDDSIASVDEQNAIAAVVHEDQTIVAGSTVKLRIIEAIRINDIIIPKDNFVFGTAQLDGERLVIEIKSIAYKKSVLPVHLSVFDIDGLDGIYIPGAITRDVAKQNADQSIQNTGLNSYDPSLGVQAASAGIEAAKSLLSRKIKLVKVFVKAGYKVLLRDDKLKQGN